MQNLLNVILLKWCKCVLLSWIFAVDWNMSVCLFTCHLETIPAAFVRLSSTRSGSRAAEGLWRSRSPTERCFLWAHAGSEALSRSLFDLTWRYTTGQCVQVWCWWRITDYNRFASNWWKCELVRQSAEPVQAAELRVLFVRGFKHQWDFSCPTWWKRINIQKWRLILKCWSR